MSINVNVGNIIPANVLEVGNEISVDQLAAITAANSPSALNPFATASHIHTIANISGLQTALDGKALLSHTHIIGDINGLQLALDGKSSVAHTHTIGNITGLAAALDGKANITHGHIIGDITGLQTALDGKSNTTHTHSEYALSNHTHNQYALLTGATFSGNVIRDNGLGQSILSSGGLGFSQTGGGGSFVNYGSTRITFADASIQDTAAYSKAQTDAYIATVATWVNTKADWGHTHTIANVTNLQTALDAKANTAHTHTIANVNGLQTALNGKANTTHTHAISDISSLQFTIDVINNNVSGKVDKVAPRIASYDQYLYVNDSNNGIQFELNYSGYYGYGRVVFSDGLPSGSRMFFTQSASATEPIIFTGTIYNKDNKLATTGPNAQVTAVKTPQGWQLFGDLIFIPNGVVLSSSCSEWTSTDAAGQSWTSYHAYTTVIADGQGNTYTTNTLNSSGCYFPYGYCIETNVQISSSTVYWEACEQNGSATYSYSYGNVRADGYGSTFTETTGGWSANYGDYIATTSSGCTIYHNGMGGYYVEYPNPPPPCPPYGTEIGTNTGTLQIYYSNTGQYYDAGTFSETVHADGMCNVAYTSNRVENWYSYGTWIGYDSMSNVNIYSNGSGSYYTEYYNPPSCPMSGQVVSESSGEATIYYNEYYPSLTAGTWYNNTYTDGYCSTYSSSGTSWYSYGTQIGYDSYNNLYIYSNGDGSYYTN